MGLGAVFRRPALTVLRNWVLIATWLLTEGCAPQISGSISDYINDGVGIYEHRVFISSGSRSGNLGGLANADALCQTLATTAGLSRTYRAMLSDASTRVRDRISLTGAIYNFSSPTVKVLVSNGDAFTTTNLSTGIFYNEKYIAYPLGSVSIPTGSTASGEISTNQHCLSWTSNNVLHSAAVTVSGQTAGFLLNTVTTCDAGAGFHILCISQ